MKKLALLFFLVFLFIASSISAGEIANVFSDSIFDLKWLSSIDEVKQKYPEGELKSENGLTSYRIYDGRTVLTIERDSTNYIDFWFNSEEKLNFVAVQFPSTGPESTSNILMKLITYFGPQSDNAKVAGKTLVIRWPEDDGFMINMTSTASMFKGYEVVFGVGYTKPVTADNTKLGF